MFDQDGFTFESQPTKEVKFSPFADPQEFERWGRSVWLVGSTLVDMEEVKEGVKLTAEPDWISLSDLFPCDISFDIESLKFDKEYEVIAKLLYGDYPILDATHRQ